MCSSQTLPCQVSKLPSTPKLRFCFNAHRIKAKAQLSEMQTRALDKVDIEEASIYEVYKLLLEDPAFTSEVRSAILDKQLCAEYAVFTAATPS